MAWLTWLLFESLTGLAIALAVVLFVLLVWWRRTGRPRPLLIGLAVAVVLLSLQQAVTTQREHATRLMTRVERAIIEARARDLAPLLAPDFRAGERGREEFVAYVADWMQRVKVRWLHRENPHIEESTGDAFTLVVGYLGDVQSDYGGTIQSRWRIRFARTAAGWQIVGIEPISIAGTDATTWSGIGRL